MKILKRKILLDDLRTKQEGLSYGVFTATSIYMKVNLTQTIDDMGIVTDLPFKRFGDPCSTLAGHIIAKNITCYDGIGEPPNTGELTAVPLEGSGVEPYAFEWSNGSNEATISNLGPGIYNVTITDAEGCQITLQGAVTVKPATDPELVGIFNVDQYYRIESTEGGIGQGTNNPYITANQPININSLTEPYNIDTIILCSGQKFTLTLDGDYVSYQWSDGSTASSLFITEAGEYSVTVVNAEGCEGTATINIEYFIPQAIEYTLNKTPKAGSGTPNDPYIFCINQFPVTIGANNLTNQYDFWTWTYGSTTPTITTALDDIGVVYQYGFTNVGGGGGLSPICCPVGTGDCQTLQKPNIHIMFSNLPQYGCGEASGTPSSG
jgi:hypothetical protein